MAAVGRKHKSMQYGAKEAQSKVMHLIFGVEINAVAQ